MAEDDKEGKDDTSEPLMHARVSVGSVGSVPPDPWHILAPWDGFIQKKEVTSIMRST